MLAVTLPIGIAVSLLLVEITGLSAGGIITPGYVALVLDEPVTLLALLGASGATWACVSLFSRYLFLFGSRRFGVTVLVGVTLSAALQAYGIGGTAPSAELSALGLIVPGLVAHQFARQGFFVTVTLIAVAAPLTRLLALAMLEL